MVWDEEFGFVLYHQDNYYQTRQEVREDRSRKATHGGIDGHW
jgi:hypothetical protein